MSASLIAITDRQPREQDTVSYWRRRARKAENLLREVLPSDLTDNQRAPALGTTHGNTGQRLRDPHGLSDCEREIATWSAAGPRSEGREMMHTLFGPTGGDERGDQPVKLPHPAFAREDGCFCCGPRLQFYRQHCSIQWFMGKMT